MAEDLYRAVVDTGGNKVIVSGGSLEKSEALKRAAEEAQKYKELNPLFKNAKGQIVRDVNPAKWKK